MASALVPQSRVISYEIGMNFLANSLKGITEPLSSQLSKSTTANTIKELGVRTFVRPVSRPLSLGVHTSSIG